MSNRTKIALGAGGGIIAVASAAFFLLGDRDTPVIGGFKDFVAPEPAVCPLSGVEPDNEAVLDRPAVAVKIENSPAAYPLSGLGEAEVVFEELVEGGITRFMAIYHCTDAAKAGPVRSSRIVDPAIMTPFTRILAYSGENDLVEEALDEAEIVKITEDNANGGLQRIERPGVSLEHTLYGDTKALRKLGQRSYEEPPADLFEFGELGEGRTKKARTITINFNPASAITYEWKGDAWVRFEAGEPFVLEDGSQLAAENIVIEQHIVNNSNRIKDSAGNPSTEIADETGKGKAVLFRDGRAIVGRWIRESEEDPVVFETKDGEPMVFAPGSIIVELLPSGQGDIEGSFSFGK